MPTNYNNFIDDKIIETANYLFQLSKEEKGNLNKWYNKLPNIQQQRFRYLLLFLRYIEKITENLSILQFLGLIFIIEGFLHFQYKESNLAKIQKFFRDNLDLSTKINLLMAFTFEDQNGHLCRKDAIGYQKKQNKEFGTNFGIFDNCLPENKLENSIDSPCRCREFLNQTSQDKIDKYLDELVSRFYEMRNSTVHRGFPAYLDFKENEFISSELVGSYLSKDNNKEIIFLGSNINFYKIITKTIKSYLLKLIKEENIQYLKNKKEKIENWLKNT